MRRSMPGVLPALVVLGGCAPTAEDIIARSVDARGGLAAPEDGLEPLQVEVTHPDGNTVTNYYDAGTYLVRRAVRTQETADGTQAVVTLVSDYREVDGVVFSLHAERRIDGTTISITSWEA